MYRRAEPLLTYTAVPGTALSRFELCFCVALFILSGLTNLSLGGSSLHSLRFAFFFFFLWTPLDRFICVPVGAEHDCVQARFANDCVCVTTRARKI